MTEEPAGQELRRDPITSSWVILAAGRGKRPHAPGPVAAPDQPDEDCPFCEGRESETPPEICASREEEGCDRPGWTVRVFPNKFPILANRLPGLDAGPEAPDRKTAYGYHEVIVDTPLHGATPWETGAHQVQAMLEMYRDRIVSHRDQDYIRYVHIIRNHGAAGAASLEHPHSQLFALPLVPPTIDDELTGFERARAGDVGCILCDMVGHEEELGIRIIAGNESFVAFSPFASRLPYESWIVPRRHQLRFEECAELDEMAVLLKDVLDSYREKLGDPPLNYWIHTYPLRGETRPYHWHLEIMPRLIIPGGLEMGAGVWVNTVAPEDAAADLRG